MVWSHLAKADNTVRGGFLFKCSRLKYILLTLLWEQLTELAGCYVDLKKHKLLTRKLETLEAQALTEYSLRPIVCDEFGSNCSGEPRAVKFRLMLLLIRNAALSGSGVGLSLHFTFQLSPAIPRLWERTEVLTMRLLVVSCAPVVSSFTLSLACLLLTAITVHNTCSHSESFPLHPLVVPLLPPCTTLCANTHTHTLCPDAASQIMSLFVSSPSPPASSVLIFFCQSVAQVFTSVMCEFWWNVASRSAGSNMSVESLNQYFLVVFLFLFHPFLGL